MTNIQVDIRKNWVDCARAFAAFGVVAVHVSASIYNRFGEISPASWWLSNVVNTPFRCSMPLFVLISGSLLLGREYDIFSFYRKRAARLIPPLVFWSVIYIFFRVCCGDDLMWIIKKDILVDGRAYVHLWFLTMISCMMIIVPYLNALVLGKKLDAIEIKMLIVISIVFYCFLWASGFIMEIKKYSMKWFLTFFNFIPYFLLGFYINKYVEKINLKCISAILISVLILINVTGLGFSYIVCKDFSIIKDHIIMDDSPLVFIQVIVICVLMKINQDKLPMHRVIRAMSENSFGIYLIHPLIIYFLSSILPRGFKEQQFYIIFAIFSVTGISLMIVSFIRKWKIGRIIC
jgi:surface polysaccharide O-acyltransferase-like enzyme